MGWRPSRRERMEGGQVRTYRRCMSVSLLNVDDHLSLEFDTSDLQAVQSYIRERYPDVSTKASGTVSADGTRA